jgi:hypothetical protein
MLVNNNTDSLPEIYIGEGENVGNRLKSHSKDEKKEFWEWAVIFVNRDNSLHKAHIQHLEASLVERAQQNKRCVLKNDVNPKKPSLPESVLFEAEDLLNDIYHIVPLLGVRAFETTTESTPAEQSEQLCITTKGISAYGYQVDGKLVVKQNSQIVPETVASISDGFKNLRQALIEKGVIVTQNGTMTFSQDYTFDSPSTAAAIVMGRSANGRTEWRTGAGVTLKEIQETEVY